VAAEPTPEELLTWVEAYERAWRAPAAQVSSLLPTVFAADATYITEPYAAPRVGL